MMVDVEHGRVAEVRGLLCGVERTIGEVKGGTRDIKSAITS